MASGQIFLVEGLTDKGHRTVSSGKSLAFPQYACFVGLDRHSLEIIVIFIETRDPTIEPQFAIEKLKWSS